MLADGKPYVPLNPLTGRRVKTVWEQVDKSLPVLINSEVWFVQLLSHKVDGICLDVRKFETVQTDTNTQYKPTDIGITLPLKEWKKLFDPIFKLLRKWKDRYESLPSNSK